MFNVTIWWSTHLLVSTVAKATQQDAEDVIDFWVGHNPYYADRGMPGFSWDLDFDPEAA